jgi:glyoxylate reductase
VTPKSRTLVTRRLPSKVVARLEERHEVDRHDGESLPAEELRERVRDKQAVVCVLTDRIDAALIDAAPELKIVANVAVGYDNVDVAYAKRRGVIVTNTPDVLTNAVAEYTWGLILAIARRVTEGDRLIRHGGWKGFAFDFMLGTELHGKQLGILGMGRIGRAVAARAPAFGMSVVYHRGGTSFQARDETKLEPRATSFDELLVTSDVISIHTPLTPQTRHLIDQRALARMKRSAYLINTSRGPVVDEEALAWGLRERLIAGAALDVFEREPDVHANLLDLDNVVLAPHLGSATRETRTAMADLAVSNVLAVLGGGQPLTPV